jgi:aminopeptidase N
MNFLRSLGFDRFRVGVTLTAFALAFQCAAGAGAQIVAPPTAVPENPFLPPSAHVFYAPDRDYDLQHTAVTLTIDYPKRAFDGVVINTLAPLRADGLTSLRFHCGPQLLIRSVNIDGVPAKYARAADMLIVRAPATLAQNRTVNVAIFYRSEGQQGTGFAGGEGGLHWVAPTPGQPNRVGFWTQGETSGNRLWMPTWDYPNDFATSETTVTVPADWTVISNGVKVSDRVDSRRQTRTVHWKMDEPHATYLTSLVAGPLDVKEDRWQGVRLRYVVPKGKADLIDASFGNTPDMLSFYSDVTGVKYAWPQYAQDAVYDFGGGMENISATTLGQGSLSDARSDLHRIVSLTSHELAHQWFGDYVTCADWGQVWLNESFATFFQMLYFEHRYGKNAYDREVADNTDSYLREAKRYKRPVVTNLYPEPDSLFDRHAYPKGGVLLHMLRRRLGDAAFFAGIHDYLSTHAHQPVTTPDLVESLTRASGINVQPYFDQWLYKPGHPVLAWTWQYDRTAQSLTVEIKQTQDTRDGTPIYDLPLTVGVIARGHFARLQAEPTSSDATFTFNLPIQPDAVLLDPDHDLLRDIPRQPWAPGELPAIVQFAPDGVDRTAALTAMLTGTPGDDLVAVAVAAIAADTNAEPAFGNFRALVALKRESLRPLFRQLSTHPSASVRAEAIRGLGGLAASPIDQQALRTIARDPAQPYAVVAAAVRVLGAWDLPKNLDIVEAALHTRGASAEVRSAAFATLAKADPATTVPILLREAAPANSDADRRAAIDAMAAVSASDAATRTALLGIVAEGHDHPQLSGAAMRALIIRHDREALPALRALLAAAPEAAKHYYADTIHNIEAGTIPPDGGQN